ncbi:MAG: DUF4125 family protein [Solidesulfovibrio sp. DCME]|uniref:DUF4125 family protein n=1 Tax=Solidesulfovibrio sp. DCME TaxID=3447380 RepID=UPI003D0CAB21
MQPREDRETLITRIVALEQDMFERISTYERSPCQDRLKTFRLMRWMTHSVLPTDILLSYLEDLRLAQEAGRNLMTEKYARIDEAIARDDGPRAMVDRIVSVEDAWMAEVRQAFPRSFPRGGEGFHAYVESEMETYSPRTLSMLDTFVGQARQQGRNLVRERYENLFRRLGYESLTAFEETMRQGALAKRAAATDRRAG